MSAPQAIEKAARARLEDRSGQIRHSLAMVREGNPLAAEPEPGRLAARLETVAQVAPAEAARMARVIQAPPSAAARVVAPGAGAPVGAERIYGDTVDFVGVAFLSQGAAAAKAVARVAFRDGRAQGSGFLISDRLFLTNHHVIGSPEEARDYVLEFGYELDPQRRLRSVTRFELDPDAFFLSDEQDDLDYTLIAVGPRVSGPLSLAEHGCCPLSGAANKHALGEVANVVQHPDGRYKEVVLRENRLVSRLDKVLHYTADTEPGSSGSPVFNNDWQVIALHHWGGPWRQKADDAGHPVPTEVNEGIRASAIVGELEGRAPGLTDGMRRLLAGALAAPALPSTPGAAPDVESHAIVASPSTARGARVNADGSVTWQIPLEVTVRLPGATLDGARPSTPRRPPAPPPQGERAGAPDADYDARGGYDPTFLDGPPVGLPRLSAAQKRVATKNRRAGPGDDPFELRYHHFSVVLNGKRRLAYLTACNLDGTTAKAISRTTGVVKPREPGQGESLDEGAEASETWYVDPRAAKDQQTFQRLYDAQRVAGIQTGKKGFLERIFQRGHLVRRTDPAWGDDEAALAADADTFHFANCTPQVGFFNMGKAPASLARSGGGRLWRALEDHVLENAVAAGQRVSVFTGPVFDDQGDPPWREHVIPGFRVPLRFWKIVAWVERGALRSLAMLADQGPVLEALPETLDAGEALADTSAVADFVTTVAEVERLTELDFGAALRAADIRRGESAPRRRSRAVARPEDLGLAAPARAPARRPRRRP